MHFILYIVIHSVFYLLKKELFSESVLESSYKIVTGFKRHLNEIIVRCYHCKTLLLIILYSFVVRRIDQFISAC